LAAWGRIVTIPTGTSERSRDDEACPATGRDFGEAETIGVRWE
jgi:hypothetical protein